MKGQRYIFTTYGYLEKIRFDRLKKICDKIFIVASKDIVIPIKIVRKAHKWGDALKWYLVDSDDEGTVLTRISYLLGRQDQKAKSDVEFILLSDDKGLDPIISSLKSAGRSCLRVGSTDSSAKEDEPVLMISPLEIKNVIEPTPVPIREFRPSLDENEVVQYSARKTLEKLQSEGHRPENLETLKHYIHLFSSNPNGQRASIDQVLEFMEANREIIIQEGVVKYNF